MKVIIQHNWTTGLGDLYCACTEYLNFIKPLKEIGYETELIFSFNGAHSPNKFIGVNDFDKIFNIKSFSLFDDISIRETPIIDLIYKNAKYYHTQYGPTSPGIHWWDVYFDIIPENIIFPNINPQSILEKKEKISVLPLFNDEVYSRVKLFKKKIKKKYDFIQVRYYDYSNEIDKEFEKNINTLYYKIQNSDKHFHVGSNSPYVNDKFLNLNNVINYEFKNLNLFSNDHSYYFYNKEIPNELLLDRLYDNLAEMVSISNSDNIFLYTTFGWISNFLCYAFISKGDKLLFKIINNNNIDEFINQLH